MKGMSLSFYQGTTDQVKSHINDKHLGKDAVITITAVVEGTQQEFVIWYWEYEM